MKEVIGLLCFVVLVAALVANAVVMLVSPRTWFRLSEWVRLTGSLQLHHQKYESGWGAIEVRLLGAFLLGLIVYMLQGMFVRRPMGDAILLFVFAVAWLGSGLFMVARPESAFHRTQYPWTRLPRWGMRLLGVLVLCGAAWLFYLSAIRLHR